MTIVGSSYSAVKRAIRDQLQARAGLSGVAISYQAPVQPLDVTNAVGSSEAIWLDDAEGDHQNVVICSTPIQLEEIYVIRVFIQVLMATSIGTQEEADKRCDELVGEFLSELANDPTWGLSTGNPYSYLHTTRSSFRRTTGFLPSGAGHGSGAEYQLEVNARMVFPNE